MRKHETPLQHGLSSQVLQMPEVREARKFFAEGKIGIAVENLARADEISSASGMPELSLLTSESLAYLHARSGDFSKEAHYRAQCAKASVGLQEKAPGISTDLTCFDCLHNSALTDIKCGRWNVATLVNARKVAMRVGNEGRGLMRMCDMTEIIASLDTLVSVSKSEHQPSSVNTEHTAALASRMTETLGNENGGERALNAAAYLVLASALDRLPQAATGSLRIDSLQACQTALTALLAVLLTLLARHTSLFNQCPFRTYFTPLPRRARRLWTCWRRWMGEVEGMEVGCHALRGAGGAWRRRCLSKSQRFYISPVSTCTIKSTKMPTRQQRRKVSVLFY